MAVAVNWVARSRHGDGRSLNQDRVAFDGVAFCVADGMGGLGGGHAAATAAVRAAMDVRPRDASSVHLAFAEANRAVLAVIEERRERVGTTLAVVVTTADGILVASIGDTRVHLQGWSSTSVDQVTVDDTVAEAHGVAPDDPRYPQAAAMLTRRLGVDDLAEGDVQIVPVAIRETTTITLTTDGVHEEVDPADLVHPTERTPDDHVAFLVSRAGSGGLADDATAVVVVVEP